MINVEHLRKQYGETIDLLRQMCRPRRSPSSSAPGYNFDNAMHGAAPA
ncbi:MAG TPA: hypothetical protein VF424_10540 [Vicinamibacterales bacterium]